ncbi:MAG TPA: FAD-dependent oxidoreductase [Dehalococcoidia bacterium]|nr:FAD-dependent oxidoreductase [Dehalococcoidia bacterium]
MAPRSTVVIVGANLAGGRAAEALRKEGFDGRIFLVGEEPHPPYERPPLSKEYLRGEMPREELFVQPESFWAEQEIELLMGVRAVSLDLAHKRVELSSGERLSFDKLLLATGGRVRRLEVPGADLEGIHYLRTVDDSEALARELRPGRRLAIVGAGFIGSEVAASAREKGLEVTMIEVLPLPLQKALGPEVGRIYADIHRQHGVELVLGEGVERFEGDSRLQAVVTSTGRRIECDLALVGVGIVPATELAEAVGLTVDNGIVVNEFCQTSHPDVYAAGDVANFYSPVLGRRLRVEHWHNAQNQGMAAARSMLRGEPYAEVPWFWSDQYDLNMQYVGFADAWDRLVFRGDVEARRFTAFYLRQGRLEAALAINRPRDIRAARELIQARAVLDPERLADESQDLRALLPQG